MPEDINRKLLAGKTAFIAGGTSGINLGIARSFASHGAKVAVLSRSADKVEAAVKELEAFGGEAKGYSADVRDPDAVAKAIAQAAGAWGPLDIVVSGAAGNFLALAKDLSPNGFKAVVDIDLLGTFNVLRAAYEHLVKPGAVVINISAPQSTVTYPMQSHVAAAKAGVDHLTRALALEWGPVGVRVNAIVPGPIEGTEGMARLAPSPKALERAGKAVPLGRLGTTDDIANLAVFLCTGKASFITGAVIPCDGGMLLAGPAGLGM